MRTEVPFGWLIHAFIYQALKFFEGRLEPVGTVGLPLVGILLFVQVPLLGRKEERNRSKRPLGMATFTIVSIIGV